MSKTEAPLPTEEKNLAEELWNFFGSIKLSFFLIILLAAVSIIGTLIPQGRDYFVYRKLYGEAVAGIFSFLGFTNLYNVWWYQTILIFILLSLVVCTMGRLKTLWSAYQNKKRDVLPVWGFFLLHFGLIIILLGYFYGHFPGASFQKSITITEGGSYHESAGNFTIKLLSFKAEADEKRRPLNYQSDVEVIENGQTVAKEKIIVNKPLVYKGIKFYQFNFSIAGFIVKMVTPKGEVHYVMIPLTEDKSIDPRYASFKLPNNWTLLVHLFYHDLAFDKDNKPYNVSKSSFPINPSAFIFINEDYSMNPKKWEKIGWISPNKPQAYKENKFYLERVIMSSGFHVKKDPGVPVLWLGSLLSMAGLFIVLYFKRE